MKRKYLLVLLLIVFLCGCNSKKTDDQHIKTTVGENRSSGSDVGRMEIVSEYHSENSHLIATGEEIDPEEYLQIFQYARKTEKGVEMVYLDSTFLSGRLLYEVSNARIVYSLKEMTLVELNDLVKGIEETFGVTAAAPVAAAAGQAAAGAEPATVTVKVTGLTDPTKKVAVLKIYKEITGLGLMDAKKAIDALPAVVKEDIKKEEAADLKKKLEEAGAVVTVA